MVKICVVFDTYGRNGLGGKTVLRVHLPIDVRGHSLQHEECPMGKKGFLIATSAGFAAAATMSGAQAADMPIKAPRYIEPSASWAGWCIGAHAGAAWQQGQIVDYGSSFSKTTFIGGGQIGYNWQHGNFVFGLEADGSGLSGKNSSYAGLESSITWLSTVPGRFGVAVGDTMGYK